MKKLVSVLLIFIVAIVSLAGCERDFIPSKEEIDEFDVIQIIGIDQSKENPADIEVTLISQKERKSENETGGGKTFDITSGSGPTAFEAQRNLKAHSDKKMFFGYIDYILIGEEAAAEDIGKYMDYISRNENIRYTPLVYIVSGCSAKELIKQTTTEEKYLGDRLDNIEADISVLSNFGEATILDIMNMLDNPNSAGIIPVIKCVDIKDEKIIGGELPEKDVSTSGYAIIKDFKLVGFIDEAYSRGYNFLMSKVKSAVVSVPDFSGPNVGLEVIYGNSKVKATFNEDTLESVTYKTTIEANIAEQLSRANIWKQSEIENLGNQLSAVVKREMEQVIAKSKELQIDCTDLGEKIRMKHPVKWEKIKDQWRDIYPKLNIQIEVQTRLRRSYDIREPNGFSEGS
jgi:spore germination protein KC